MINKYPHLIITIFAALLFIPFLGAVHLFDWDEINFAEAAREMILTGNYGRVQINYEPFWEKPPIFFWLQVGCMKVFGINEFAARLPNALCGIVTLNILFYHGKKIVNSKVAWWWVLLYTASFTPHFYFKSGIIDPLFNLFIYLSLVHIFLGSTKQTKRTSHFAISGIFLGLALLTKGPVAVLIVGLCGLVFLIINRFNPYFSLLDIIVLFFSMLLLPLLWFVPDWISNGLWFTKEFLNYQAGLFLHPIASHGQPWYYHPIVLLIGCFPAAIIGLPYLLKSTNRAEGTFFLWMKIMFWVVLILFSMVTTKIVHYSSLCYIPLTFLGAWGLAKSNGRIQRWQQLLILSIGLIYGLVFILMPMIGSGSPLQGMLLEYIKDDFTKQNILVHTAWVGIEWILGIVLIGILSISFIIYKNKTHSMGINVLLISMSFFIFLFSIMVIPKIENHVQGSIISFYKSLQNKEVYIETVGFKSYAHYYYTQKPVPSKQDKMHKETMTYCRAKGIDTVGQLTEAQRNMVYAFKRDWMMNGEIDKPVYLVYKVGYPSDMDSNHTFKKVLDKGGFVVFKRNNFR